VLSCCVYSTNCCLQSVQKNRVVEYYVINVLTVLSFKQIEWNCDAFDNAVKSYQTRKLCYRKDDRAMRPTLWVPWNFLGLPNCAHGHYSQHFHVLLFWSTLWMFLQNLKSVALPVREIIGGSQKIWAVPGYAYAHFSPKFLMGFYSDRPCKYTRQIWSQ